MALGTPTACPAGEWTKVATGVTVGWMHIQEADFNMDVAYYTYVPTTDAAPTLEPTEDGSKAIQLEGRSTPINVTAAIDIYIWALAEDVKVIMDAA